MQKARSQTGAASEEPASPPTACRHVVSGSVSLPAQGCFSPVPHGTRPLSVTRESLALEGGPPSFTPDYSSRALLRIATSHWPQAVIYRALTVSGAPFQGTSTGFATGRPWILQPRDSMSPGLGHGPVRSPLLRASQLISLPPGTEMFQFPGFASLGSPRDDWCHHQPGCPIRPPRDHCVCATAPSFSQLTAAFLASVCPGIPHMPSSA